MMDELIRSVFTAPVGTVFIVAGVVFLFIAVVGNISGKIEPGLKGRIASGVLGLLFVLTGLVMHLTQGGPGEPGHSERWIEQTKRDQRSETTHRSKTEEPESSREPSGLGPALGPKEPATGDQQTEASQDPAGERREARDSAPSRQEKEPNDHVNSANLISEGATIRGSVGKKQDRDFFKIKTSGIKTRIILRRSSLPGFNVYVEIFDTVENRISYDTAYGDTPLSLSFKSDPSSFYFIVVRGLSYTEIGDYELVVRKD